MNNKHHLILYHLMALFAVVVWGITFVSTKVLINHGVSPTEIMFYRFAIAYILLASISFRKIFSNSIKDELLFVALGITGGSLYFVTENMAIGYTLASNVSILLCTAPIFTAIFMRIFFHESLKRSFLWGSTIAIIGVSLVVFNGRFVLELDPIGDLLILAAALSWSFYIVILKKVDQRYETLFITRKVFFYGLLTLLPIFLFTPLHFNTQILSLPAVWGNLLFLGIIASFICFILWNLAVKKLGGIRPSNYIYFSPLITLITSMIVLQEPVTHMALLGSFLIIGGVYTAERGFPKRNNESKKIQYNSYIDKH